MISARGGGAASSSPSAFEAFLEEKNNTAAEFHDDRILSSHVITGIAAPCHREQTCRVEQKLWQNTGLRNDRNANAVEQERENLTIVTSGIDPSPKSQISTTSHKNNSLDCFCSAESQGEGNDAANLTNGNVIASEHEAVEENCGEEKVRVAIPSIQDCGSINGHSSRNHLFPSKKAAFTLAEVLITLGIIGVVAAMTMPALMSNYRKHVVETRLAKFYSTMNQAIQRAEVDYGDKKAWGEIGNNWEKDENGNDDTTKSIPLAWFNKYMRPYLKLTDVKVNKKTGKVMAYFPDGSLCLIGGSSLQFWPSAKDFKDYGEDESGKLTNPMELSGIKYFTFFFVPGSTDAANKYHYNKGIEPYKWHWDGTEENLRNHSSLGCQENVSNERAYCAALIQLYGWKVPKDYPLKF